MKRAVLLAVALAAEPGTTRAAEAVFDLSRGAFARRPGPAEDRPAPAGSLFKVAAALEALRGGHDRRARCSCDGRRCWLARGHGVLNLEDALALSCSAYFEALHARIDRGALRELARALGFEGQLVLEDPAAIAGDHASIAIRPTRAALLMAWLAAGRMPHGLRLDARDIAVVRAGLQRGAAGGTAEGLLLRVGSAAAKTGTALTPSHGVLGWCAGFAPADSPRYAFAVMVRGQTARRGAVPAAARLLESFHLAAGP